MLDPSRYAALKTDIAVRVAAATFADPTTPDLAATAADFYNAAASPSYLVWDTVVPVAALRALVDLSKYTPADPPPATGALTQDTNNALLYNNRALACQLKQTNVQFVLQGMNVALDCSVMALRQIFADCMTAIPSGASGANQNAGWGTAGAPGVVRLRCMRPALAVEKLFSAAVANPTVNSGNVSADPRGGNTNPDALAHIGPVTYAEVLAARNS